MEKNHWFYFKRGLLFVIPIVIGFLIYFLLGFELGNSNHPDTNVMNKKLNLEKLLSNEDFGESIIEIDNYISKLCSYGEDIKKLTEPQKQFYFNQRLETEINNGGFSQYFYNSSGDFAHQTIESLLAIGANKTAILLQEAIDQFPNRIVPQDRLKRQEILTQIEKKAEPVWDSLDEKFYDYEDDLNALNFAFIKQNKDKF